MPTFADVPFTMDGVEAALPRDLHPMVGVAMKASFEDIVRRADDIITLQVFLDPNDPLDTDLLTVEHIDACRMGMVAGASALLELLAREQMLDPVKWGQYLVGLIRKEGS